LKIDCGLWDIFVRNTVAIVMVAERLGLPYPTRPHPWKPKGFRYDLDVNVGPYSSEMCFRYVRSGRLQPSKPHLTTPLET